MIISRTPYRISFLGGGTDYPAWYRQHGGAVIATTIDKYCYLTCRYLPPFFEHRTRIVYSKIEAVQAVEEIGHSAVREILKFMQVERGVEIHHDGDLPARSGMGSSSSFTVGLLHALHALHGRMVNKHQLALEGIHVEQDCLKETVGSQDQVMAAYGGLNHVQFLASGDIAVRPVIMPVERIAQFNKHLMLFYTGIKRTASTIADSYANDMQPRRRQFRILLDLVKEGLSILSSNHDLCGFGELLHEAWLIKRSLSQSVSNSSVDEIYQAARSAGAVGGKLLGAGGGGFIMIYAPPEKQEAIREKLAGLIYVPCQFEFNGSQIIFYDRETDYSREEESRKNGCINPFEEHAEKFCEVGEGAVRKASVIFVAGGETLIGAAILRVLKQQGFENVLGDPGEQVDLCSATAVESFFAQYRPEYVFHAGGRSGGIAANTKWPAELAYDNLLGSVHVVHAAHTCGVKRLLYLASSCSYPRLCPQPMQEENLLTGPLEPTNEAYAVAKLAGLKLCQAYRQQYGDDFLAGIPANAFGPGDDFSPEDSHVIAALIRRFHEAKLRGAPQVSIWGSGQPRREFIYVDDLADACLFVMEHYRDAAPLNLGGGTDLSIAALAEKIRAIVGFTGSLEFDASRPDGMPLKALDSSKLLGLGWRPSFDFDDGLRRTYEAFLSQTG